jgi:DNA-binding transcriptional ArsR family regulator
MPNATLDRVTAAVSDPTRRAILDRLVAGPARAGDLAAPFAISQPAVSRHLRVLEEAGLIVRTRAGREHVLALAARPLRELQRWTATYERFWTEKVDRLERHFNILKETS